MNGFLECWRTTSHLMIPKAWKFHSKMQAQLSWNTSSSETQLPQKCNFLRRKKRKKYHQCHLAELPHNLRLQILVIPIPRRGKTECFCPSCIYGDTFWLAREKGWPPPMQWIFGNVKLPAKQTNRKDVKNINGLPQTISTFILLGGYFFTFFGQYFFDSIFWTEFIFWTVFFGQHFRDTISD